MLESLCRCYCSDSWYRYLGASFWPEKLAPNWLELITELDPTVKILAVTSVGIAAGGVYWMRHRHNPVASENTVELMRSGLSQVTESSNQAKSSAGVLPKRRVREPIEKIVNIAPEQLNEIVIAEQQAAGINPAPQCFPVWPIVSAYISDKPLLKARKNSSFQEKAKVIQEVLSTLNLPLTGIYPTQESDIAHFNHVVTDLGLNQYCVAIKDGLRIS